MVICECCMVLSAWLEFRPETVSDTVRSRPISLYMITLVMIWLRVLPHGMDGCSPQNYHLFFFCFIFRFTDFSVAFVSRRGGSLRWISKISNQLNYFLSLGLFFLQSNIAYVVLLTIFRLPYMISMATPIASEQLVLYYTVILFYDIILIH